MLSIPFYKQDTDFSCGPAVLRMIFESFGKIFSEQYLIASLSTSINDGTPHGKLISCVHRHGLHAHIDNAATIESLTFYVENQRLPVIVNYIEPSGNEGHYTVSYKVIEHD
jgi:ABC-type bacteriocin/lantibiotic exporter with double-glycine peptidase domain